MKKQQKRRRTTAEKEMVRGLSVLDRLEFELADDHLITGNGLRRREVYLLRLHPKNMDILSLQERLGEYTQLQSLLDADCPAPSFLSMDKTEGLDEIRDYYEELVRQYPGQEQINGGILRQLTGLETEENSCVERAHYLILRVRDRSEYARFMQVASGYLHFQTAERAELLVVLKNFLLREYTAIRLADWDEEIRLKYEEQLQGFQAKKQNRKKQPPAYADIARRETLRLLLPNRLRFDSRYVEQGGLYRQAITVRGYPAELASDSALRQLGAMAGVTLRLYLEPISAVETSDMLQKQINQRRSAAISARKESDRVREALEQQQVVEAYRGQIERTRRMYYVTILAETYGRDPEQLQNRVERIRAAFTAQGFVVDDLRWEQREGFLSMLPYGVNLTDTFKRNMPTRTLAALYPFTASRKADPQGLLLGRTSAGSPLFWDPALRSETITNGITLIAGSSGQGKSYLMKKIISQLIARGWAVYGLDAEQEYVELYAGCGGSNQNCAGGGVKINPLEIRRISDSTVEADFSREEHTETDPEGFRESSALLQHLDWLRAFHRLLLPDLNEAQRNILMILIQQHYAQRGIGRDFDPEGQPPDRFPTYSTLYRYIEERYDGFEEQSEENKLLRREDLRVLLLALHDVHTGAASAVFNGHTNVKNARVINFVVQALLDGDVTMRNAALFNVMSWIWNRVVTRRERMAFFIDEMYLFLNPIVVEWLRNFAKRARKYGAHMFQATQNLADFNDPEILHMTKPLFELSLHKFLFYPGDVDRTVMQKLLSLTDSEMDVISVSRQRHCLYKCANEKYHLIVGTLPYERELFGSAGG